MKFISFILLFSFAVSAAAKVTMSLSEPSGALNQRVKLIIEAEQRQDVQQPDFSPLEDHFEILSQSKQSSASFRNGQSVYSNRWTLSLIPLATGEITIPGILIGSERARPISYTVLPEAEAPPPADVRVELIMEQLQGYQLSAFQLRTQVAYAVDLAQAELQEPAIDNALIFRTGPQTQGEEEYRGTRYQTISQRYLVFPQTTGQFRVEPIVFTGTDRVGNAIDTESEPLVFDVLAPPTKPWLPASEFRIEERWEGSLDDLKIGDTLKRQIILEAHNLPADWIPTLEMPSIEGISVHPKGVSTSQDASSGVLVSRKIFDYEVLLTRAGPQRLPAVKIPWWDTIREQADVSELPIKELVVEQFSASKTPSKSVSITPNIKSLDGPINEKSNNSSVSWHAWLWALIALICAAGWSLSYARLKRLQAKQALFRAAPVVNNEPDSSKEDDRLLQETSAFNQLARACNRNQPQLAYQYLIEWAQLLWPSIEITDLEDVQFNARDATLGYLLKDLEYHLHQPDEDDPWQGDILFKQLQKIRYKNQLT